MKYRSMNEIFESILCSIAINDGLGFKKIMYSCYLSYAQVTRFLQFAKENDFLVHDNNMGLFKIKDKNKKQKNTRRRKCHMSSRYSLSIGGSLTNQWLVTLGIGTLPFGLSDSFF